MRRGTAETLCCIWGGVVCLLSIIHCGGGTMLSQTPPRLPWHTDTLQTLSSHCPTNGAIIISTMGGLKIGGGGDKNLDAGGVCLEEIGLPPTGIKINLSVWPKIWFTLLSPTSLSTGPFLLVEHGSTGDRTGDVLLPWPRIASQLLPVASLLLSELPRSSQNE